jgi:hypothetical protein
MSINTSNLPSYTEQDTKKLISPTIAIANIRKIDIEREAKKIKSLQIYGKGKK